MCVECIIRYKKSFVDTPYVILFIQKLCSIIENRGEFIQIICHRHFVHCTYDPNFDLFTVTTKEVCIRTYVTKQLNAHRSVTLETLLNENNIRLITAMDS